jgi:hypothetical protein
MKRPHWLTELNIARNRAFCYHGAASNLRAVRLDRVLRAPESLEPRCLLATFVVNHVGDAPDFNLGDGVADSDAGTPGVQITLRTAIQNANLDAALDNIHFNIPGTGVKVISPTSGLPIISQPVVIDGYTQPGAAPNTMAVGSNATIVIQLDGMSAGATSSGLSITAGGSTVKGLSITRFTFQGLRLQASDNSSTVVGNFIGVPPAGDVDRGNTSHGILIYNSAGNVIGGPAPGDRNVISGNDYGIVVAGTSATGNVIQGNYIGTNAAGMAAVANANDGVFVGELETGGGTGSMTQIGGLLAGSGNLISGNLGSGVSLVGAAVKHNKLQGNYIGVNAAGGQALSNGRHGVLIAFADSTAASENTIGGDDDDDGALDGVVHARNIISGNGRAGVAIFGAGAEANEVQGNYIGTDVSGMHAIPNANDGVRIGDNSLGAGPSANNIGGPLPGAGNLISGNMDNGIELAGATTSVNAILGNRIGTTADGNAPRPNQRMGVLVDGAKETFIGGAEPEARNVISGNGAAGISLSGASAAGNAIEGNYLGVGANGTTPLPNQDGVLVTNNASGNTIGGAIREVGNVIAHNTRDGVRVESGARNAVRLNSIHHNGGLGIDLNGDKETLNDQDDADAGANNAQNWPEILNLRSPQEGVVSVYGFFEGKDNTEYSLDFYVNDGSAPLGQGAEYLATAMVPADANGYSGFSFSFELANPLGKFLTVTATDPDGNTSEFSHDADTDGLYDHWESSRGVDGNGDGTSDFFLANPNPRHKDLYVEVDAMGVIDPAEAGMMVADAFAAAPADNLLNPDGVGGVTLHFELDPDRIEEQAVTGLAQLRAVKNSEFGTQAQRVNANLLAAKRMTHRYALFAPWADNFEGLSNLWTHEFYVSFGPASALDLAPRFMHELGHALFLDHGGGDEIGFKPNYHSVMNYARTVRPLDPGDFQDSWELDYSSRAFPTLDENHLIEAEGIRGHSGHVMKVGPSPFHLVPELGPVDWNQDGDQGIDGDIITTGIDLNELDGSGLTALNGYDDWSNLLLNHRHSYDYRVQFGLELANPQAPVVPTERSYEQYAEWEDQGYANQATRVYGLPDVVVNAREVISFITPASDPEGNALTFSLGPGAPPNATIHPTTGEFTWPTGDVDGGGQYVIAVRVTDAGSLRMRERNYGFVVTDFSADFNDDNNVDGADFLAWQRGLGIANNGQRSQGDADGDGNINREDLDVWRSTFALPAAPSVATTTSAAQTSSANTSDFNALAGLWPVVDAHRTISGDPVPRPAAPIAAEARAVAFARFLDIQNSYGEEDVELFIADDRRKESRDSFAMVHELIADRLEYLSASPRRLPASVLSGQSS